MPTSAMALLSSLRRTLPSPRALVVSCSCVSPGVGASRLEEGLHPPGLGFSTQGTQGSAGMFSKTYTWDPQAQVTQTSERGLGRS